MCIWGLILSEPRSKHRAAPRTAPGGGKPRFPPKNPTGERGQCGKAASILTPLIALIRGALLPPIPSQPRYF